MITAVVLLLAVSQKAETVDLVRGRIETKGDVWVGQRVTLVVTLYSPTFFSGAPSFDLPRIPGVVILPPQDRPILGNETIGDDTYTTQRHELAVYPQRPGTVRIPPISVRFASDGGIGKPPVQRRGATRELMFDAKMPPGAEKLSTVVTTPELTLTEAWKPQPGKAKLGAAFTRTVTVKAKGVPGMVLPPMRWDAPEGISVYPAPATVTDSTERGETTGQRAESVTYVFEKAGTYRLAGVALTWWDAERKQLRRERLPSQTFEVADSGEKTEPPDEQTASAAGMRRWSPVALAVVLGVVAVVAALVAVRLIRRGEPERVDSEEASFARFRRACQSEDAGAIHRTLLNWSSRIGFLGDPILREEPEFGSRQLQAQIDALEGDLYGRGGPKGEWSPERIYALAESERKAWKGGRVATGSPSALPPLNPSEQR